jgi:hypothetical protein
MAAEGGIVYQDHMIADVAIVGHMSADHEQTSVTDFGEHAAALSARVHGDMFSDHIIGADLKGRRLAIIF